MSDPPETQQELDTHYAQLRAAIGARNFQRSAVHLKGMFDILPKHPDHVGALLRDLFSNGLALQDYVQILATYKSAYPEDPTGYLMAMDLLREQGTFEQVRMVWQETCTKATRGFHFQPAIQASVFDAENTQRFTAISVPGLSDAVRRHLQSILADDARIPLPEAPPPEFSEPFVETCPSEPLNMGALTLNGRVTGIRTPSRFYFRYGSASDRLDQKTKPRHVPGPLNGRVMDTGENLSKRITAYAGRLTFRNAQSPPNTDANVSALLEWPFGKDRNHKNGIGIIDLVAGWKSAAHDRPRSASAGITRKFPSGEYPGESIDLRDAVLSITYRSDAFDQRQFRPVAWIHGRTGTAVYPEHYDDLAAWACTYNSHDAQLVGDGTWRRMDLSLPAHSFDWSFCGSNTEEMGDTMARYTYAPIQNLQRDNTSGNICLTFIGGNELATPEGDIEVAAFELNYRSRSLLAPGQGSSFVGGAENHRNDPALLTDGTIGIPSRYWLGDFDDAAGCTLTWQLGSPAEIDCIKLHQNPLAPTNTIEISASSDGKAFDPVWSGALDDVPEDPAAWGELVANGEGSGLCRVVVLDKPVNTRFLRVQILSSYRPDIVGLDAVEVFSTDTCPVPDGAPVTVSELVEGLPHGQTVYAQLVIEDDDGELAGDIVSITLPDDRAPQILNAVLLPARSGDLRLKVRTRAAGSMTGLVATISDADGAELASTSTEVGKWDAPRDSILYFPAHADAAVAQIVLTNATGEATYSLPLT